MTSRHVAFSGKNMQLLGKGNQLAIDFDSYWVMMLLLMYKCIRSPEMHINGDSCQVVIGTCDILVGNVTKSSRWKQLASILST